MSWRSCSGVRTRPLHLSNSVSGTLSVGRLGEVLVSRTSFAQVIGLVRLAGQLVTQSRCFSCLSGTWRAEFGDAVELPCWLELLRQGVDIFAIDYDTIFTAMYALTIGTEGDSSLCVLPDPGIKVVALGASESALPSTTPAEAVHTFTLDSGASRCFFRDSTTLTPLSALVPVKLADPSGGPVLARSSTILPCRRFVWLTVRSSPPLVLYELGEYRCPPRCDGHDHQSCGSACVDLSSLYTLATKPPQVAAYAQMSASGPVAPPCSCRLLLHQTLLWHHRLGHPSLPPLCGMHSRLLVSGLPRSLPTFKAHYVARGFNQRQGVDYFQTFSPTLKITTLWVLLHVAAQCDYELHSLDFSTAFLQGSLHEEIWLCRPPGFTGSFPAGTQWSLWRPVYGLRQAPREWHDTLRTTLAALGFTHTADPSLFLRTDTSLPSFYVLVYVDDLVFATADTEALTLVKSELQKRHTCTDLGLVLGGRGLVVLTGHADAFWVDDSATQRSSQGYTFSLRSGSVSWRSTRSSSVLSSSCEAEIYAGAMAAQELRWLTYLQTDLGEQPRSPPVPYVDTMIALCQENRLKHRTKHIALRYFLARELQQRGQLRLAYVATMANTADIFTKALPPGDHQRFSTVLGLVPTLPHLLTA
ncbi:unnamed protein product [Closterium sp. NIES-54]